MAEQSRMSITLDPLVKQAVVDYAKQEDISQNEVINDALMLYIEIKSGLYDYNEPALERLNNIIDAIVGLRSEQTKTVETMERMESVMLRYMNGENYYND